MRVKQFSFPTYEELKKLNFKFEETIGSHTLKFDVIPWCGNAKTYAMGVGTYRNPLDLCYKPLYYVSYTCGAERGLEAWYNAKKSELVIFWNEFIKEHYIAS